VRQVSCELSYIRIPYTVDVERSASGDAGASSDESVLDVVRHDCREPSFHPAVISLFVLASHTDWVASVTNASLGQTPAKEAG